MAQIISTTLSKKQNKVLTDYIVDCYGDTLYTVEEALQTLNGDMIDLFKDKQDKLVSGTNIKTINNISLLGGGNISITTSAQTPSNLVLYTSEKCAYGATGSWEFYQKGSTTHKCNIVYGTVSINKTSIHDQTVTFAKSLPTANYSLILTVTINNSSASREVFTSVYSRSTVGFICNAHIANTSYKIVSLHYIAIYNS